MLCKRQSIYSNGKHIIKVSLKDVTVENKINFHFENSSMQNMPKSFCKDDVNAEQMEKY